MVVLGLDIGGANLKAATVDKRAVSVPFALWKQPDKLPAALAELVAQFPDVDELAVTMTGELCDCYETKREGVNAILDATELAAKGRTVRVWSTDGAFVSVPDARANHLKVAAANWHALATFAGRYEPHGAAILVDIGSTTTDVIPLFDGVVVASGRTDVERLANFELIYTGARRTPACVLLDGKVATEFFATAHDAYLLLEMMAPNPDDNDTADGRPATRELAHARMSRMLGGDATLITTEQTRALAENVLKYQVGQVACGLHYVGLRLRELEAQHDRNEKRKYILSGQGEFIARAGFERGLRASTIASEQLRSLNDELGPTVSACAPAYAVAMLATEQQ